METPTVKDLMVPLADYGTISEDATLYEAVIALEKAQKENEHSSHPYRALLVRDGSGTVIGKLSQLDVLRGLEPKYSEISDLKKVSGFGISKEYLHSIMAKFDLWKAPLHDLCGKALEGRIGQMVGSPLEGEIIDADAPLNRAIHQLVVGHFQSLIVVSKGAVVGLLRLVDVFEAVVRMMKACKI